MNKSSTVLAVSMLGALCAPLAAEADDIVDLSYQSAPLTGTYTELVSGLPSSNPFVTAAYSGTMTGSAVLPEQPDGDYGVVSYSFVLTGTGSSTGVNAGFDTYPTPIMAYSGNCNGATNCIGLYTTNGVITGANVDLRDTGIETDPVQAIIGPQGDSVNVQLGVTCSTTAAIAPRGRSTRARRSFADCRQQTRRREDGQ
jgi:hypothetical protein